MAGQSRGQVMDKIRNHTQDNVVELLNVTPSQAYRLLKKMSDKGRIKLIGSGRSAYYELVN